MAASGGSSVANYDIIKDDNIDVINYNCNNREICFKDIFNIKVKYQPYSFDYKKLLHINIYPEKR